MPNVRWWVQHLSDKILFPMIKIILNSQKEYDDLIISLAKEYDSNTILSNGEHYNPSTFPCVLIYEFGVTDHGYDIFEAETVYFSDFLDP